MNFRKGIPALVLAALGCSWSFGAVEFKEAELTTVKNLVEHDPGTGAAPAKVNEKIGEKSKVSTSAASMAELTFADSSITRMGSNTQFSFQSKERLVKLEKGTILVHTPPGNGGATVECGGVTGAVSGTTFMASRDGVGNVMFVLLEGQGGLKVTVGGTSTVIRPGQAASVGADAAQSSSTPSKSDAPGGGVQGESKAAAGDDSSGGAGPAKTPAGPDSGSGPASAGEGPAPAKPVEIKVFEVDVKKVIATTPLVTEFKNELPSAKKIEATIEVQQAKVQDGKLEKLEVEVVAVAKEDGDFLIGSPKLDPEEMKIVNSKDSAAGRGGSNRLDVDTAAGGNSLDVDTAAGPGAGAGTPVAASPAPRAETPAPAPPVATPSSVNPGQIVVNPPTSTTVPKTAVAIKVNDATRPFGQPNPSTFGFSITAGQLLTGHSLISEFLTTAAVNSPVSGSPYAVSFFNPRIVDASGADVSSRYDLTTAAGVLNIIKASPNLVFGPVGSLVFGQSVDLVAAALNGSPTFEVISGEASVVDGKLVATSGTGSVVVRASTPDGENYLAATVEQTITLEKAGQSVSFTLPSSLTFGEGANLSASAVAGDVSFEVVSGAGQIVDGKLVATSGTGTVQVRAVTAGDGNYDGASAVQTITLAKAGQSVNFTLPTSLTYDASTSLAALPTGAGSVTYELVNPADSSKVSISGGQLKALSGTGNVQVRAVTAGDSNYDGASAVQTITLAKAGQSVNFTLPTSLTYDASTSLAALPTGAGSVTYELVNSADSSKVSISGGQLKALSGTGTVQVRAVTAGDSNYDGASAVQTITLAKAAQVLSLSGLPEGIFGTEYSPVLSGVQVGTANLSVRETDGRAGISGGKVNLGKIFGASSFTLDVSAAGNDNFLPGSTTRTINIQRNVAAVEAANPIRDLLGEGTKSFFSWTSDALAQGYELELGGGEKVPGGQTIRLTSSYYEADGNFATAKVRRLGVSAVAPEENLTGFVSGNDMPAAEMLALDNYFYFSGKAAGVTDGPSDFFVNAATERTLVPSDHGPSVQLGTTAQSYGLYTAKTWKAGSTPLVSAGGGVEKKIFYGDRVDLTSPGAFWDDLSLWDGSTLPVVDSDQRWANFLSRISDAPDAASLVWDDQGGILSGAADIYLSGLRELSLVAGSGGIAMQGATLVADQTSVDLTTTGDLEIKTAKIMGIDAPIAAPGENQKSGQLTLEAGGKVKLGAQTVAGNAPTQTEAKDQQVRLEAVETSAGAPSMAVIRTGDSMELRNVTIRNFDGSKLEKVIRNSDGTTTLHGRVLMSGSAVKDFKIKELVGAAVNADAKIQMMAMDMNGNLAGEMMVEGQLPVATELARKLDASITGLLGEKPVHAASIDLTAKTVNFNNATITAMNAITARANTVIVQNSFMTVVRSSGMINMYVREGMVNMGFGTVRDGYANFAGANTFQFGNVAFNISNQDQLNAAYGTRLFDTQNSAGTQAGAINVLKL